MHCLSGEVYEGGFNVDWSAGGFSSLTLLAHGEGVWRRGRGVSLDVLALTERYTVIPAPALTRF